MTEKKNAIVLRKWTCLTGLLSLLSFTSHCASAQTVGGFWHLSFAGSIHHQEHITTLFGMTGDRSFNITDPDELGYYLYGLGYHDSTMSFLGMGESGDYTEDTDVTATFTWADYYGNKPANLMPPPDTVTIAERARSAWILYLPSPAHFHDGTADDGFHDPLITDDVSGVSEGSHLITKDSRSGTFTLHHTAHVAFKAAVGINDDGTAIIWGNYYRPAEDWRSIRINPKGYETTFRPKLTGSKDAYGLPLAIRDPNVADDNTLRADIGLPYWNSKGGDYSGISDTDIAYQALISGPQNWGDTYKWAFTLHPYIVSGDLPSLLYGYSIREEQLQYSNPLVKLPFDANDRADVVIKPYDADPAKPENSHLHYTYVNDGAKADFDLNVYFHQPLENWQKGISTELPEEDKPLSNKWYPVGTAVQIMTGNEVLAGFAEDAASLLTVSAALAGKDVRIAAALTALGLGANWFANSVGHPQTYIDTISNFQFAV